MIKKITFLSLIAGFCQFVSAQTTIPGGPVAGNWTLAGSPYLVQGSIQVAPGYTLTIDPGVKVEFQGSYKFIVQGQLLAVGTAADTIVFTAANRSAGWRSIRFDNTSSSNDTSRLSYCRIKYGRATGASPDDNGGAIYFDNFSNAVISNCRIDSCMAVNNGGGIYLSNSSPRIYNNTIERDTAKYGAGGGLYTSGSDIFLFHNLFRYNVVTAASVNGSGGAMFLGGGSPTVTSNTITNNYASVGGAGILDYANTSIISNNKISGNNTPGTGGGIFINNGDHQVIWNTIDNNTANRGGGIASYTTPVISYNFITNNTAVFSSGNDGDGAGIYLYGADPTISNNVICNNEVSSVNGHSGAIHCNNSNPTIINCTISNNKAPVGGAMYCMNASVPVLRNVIMWGNTATQTGNQVALNDEASDPDIYFSDIEGGSAAFDLNGNFYTGTYSNNINGDPSYLSPTAGSGNGFNAASANWAIPGNSPCADAGDPAGTYLASDIAGNTRVSGTAIDMGAYEYQGSMGIAGNNSAMVSLYPNPAAGHVRVNSVSSNENEVNVLNALGSIVKTGRMLNGNCELNIETLPAGVYSVEVKSDKGRVVQKLVISN